MGAVDGLHGEMFCVYMSVKMLGEGKTTPERGWGQVYEVRKTGLTCQTEGVTFR